MAIALEDLEALTFGEMLGPDTFKEWLTERGETLEPFGMWAAGVAMAAMKDVTRDMPLPSGKFDEMGSVYITAVLCGIELGLRVASRLEE